VAVTTRRVGADGVDAGVAATGQEALASTGALGLVLDAGDLLLSETTGGVTADGAVLLQAAGAVTAQAGVTAGGALSVTGASITQGATGDFTSSAGTLDVQATAGAIVMDDGAVGQTSGGAIRYEASGALTLGLIDARKGNDQAQWGAVTLKAGDGIADLAGNAAIDVYANQLSLEAGAGVGAAGELLETDALTLVATVASGLFLHDSGALTLLGAEAGTIVLASGGDLAIAGAVDATGLARIASESGSLSVQAGVSAGGNLALLAATGYVQGAFTLSSMGGTVDLSTTTGELTMAAASAATSNGQAIRVAADGAITLGSLDARTEDDRTNTALGGQASWGSISVVAATGSIEAADAAATVHAGALRLNAGGAIGGGAALRTEAATLTAAAGGDLFIDEATALRIDAISLQVTRLNALGTVSDEVSDGEQTGVSSGGQLVLRTGVGSLTVASGNAILADGDVVLSAGGGLVLDASVESTAGAIVLVADDAITQSGSTSVVTGGGDITVDAGGALTVTTLDAGSGSIAITAASLVDADAAADTAADLVAGDLVLDLTGNAGSTGNAIETDVQALSVQGGDVYVANAGALVIGEVSAATVVITAAGDVSVESTLTATGNVLVDAGTGSLSVEQSIVAGGSLTLAAGGNVALGADAVLEATAGDIVVNAGGTLAMDANSGATAGGNLQLQAGGDATITGLSASAVVVTSTNGAILDAGDVTLDIAAGQVLLQAGGDVGGADAIDLNADVLAVSAEQGDVTIAELDGFTAGSVTVTVAPVGTGGTAGNGAASSGVGLQAQDGGSIVVATGGDLVLEASATLTVTGSVSTSGSGTASDIVAGGLTLAATAGVGASGAALQTSVDTLDVLAGGAIHVAEENAVTITGLEATSAGAVVLVAGGDVTVTGMAGSTDGNVLVQSTGGTLSIQATVEAGGAGNLSVLAESGITLTASGELAAGGTVQVEGGSGAVGMDVGSSIAATGDVSVHAGGNVTVSTITTDGTASIVTTGGSIADAGVTGINIDAAAVQLVATGGVGSDAAPLELDTDTLAASGGAGGLYLLEADAITIGTVQATVQGVSASGGSTAAAGNATSDLTTTDGGAVQLVTTNGSITLGEGSGSDGAVSAGGSVTLAAGGAGSDVLVEADVRSAGGSITVTAADSVLFDNGASIGTSGSGDVAIVATGGDVIMDIGSALESGTGSIVIDAGGDIEPGLLQTEGSAQMNAGGAIVITSNSGSSGDDINIRADDVRITGPLSSPGAVLNITPLTNVPVVIGGTEPATPALHLSRAELLLLQDGFSRIVIGGTLAGQVVQLQGGTTPVVFRDPVVLVATNGSIAIDGEVHGDALTLQASTGGTSFNGVTLSLQAGLRSEDQVTLEGAASIASNLGGAGGNIVFTQAIAGNGGATADTMVLDANGGDVSLADVANLDGLSIADAVNVTFGGSVTLDGDLVIEATGLVTFSGPVVLNNGARLVVQGGGQVVFQDSVDAGSGDVTIAAATLSITGGSDSFAGTGVLSITSTNAAILVGDGGTAGIALRLDGATLQALDGFSSVLIGNTGAGTVTLAGAADFGTLASEVQVSGATVNVAADADIALGGGSFALESTGAVSFAGAIVASAATDVRVESTAGAVTMTAAARIASEGGDVKVAGAAGLALGTVDARGAGTTAGLVTVDAGTGTLTDAKADTAADVFAQAVTVRGSGPAQGSGGDVVEVSADLVYVDAAGGIVLRESTGDGRMYYSVLRDHTLYQAVVSTTMSIRVTEDPATIVNGPQAPAYQDLVDTMQSAAAASFGSGAQPMVARSSFGLSSPASPQVQQYLSSAGNADAAGITVSMAGLRDAYGLMSDASYGLAGADPAWVLGSPGTQPLADGSASAAPAFDYWVETLEL
jgi:hypothetical protein